MIRWRGRPARWSRCSRPAPGTGSHSGAGPTPVIPQRPQAMFPAESQIVSRGNCNRQRRICQEPMKQEPMKQGLGLWALGFGQRPGIERGDGPWNAVDGGVAGRGGLERSKSKTQSPGKFQISKSKPAKEAARDGWEAGDRSDAGPRALAVGGARTKPSPTRSGSR